jgi:hypothetical protein
MLPYRALQAKDTIESDFLPFGNPKSESVLVQFGISGSKSKLANAAMDKMGQIRRTSKWLRSQSKMPLQAEYLPAADILLRYLCHFDAAKVDLVGPDPSWVYETILIWG